MDNFHSRMMSQRLSGRLCDQLTYHLLTGRDKAEEIFHLAIQSSRKTKCNSSCGKILMGLDGTHSLPCNS